MGKVQKVHHFERIERRSFFLFIAFGLALGFSTGYMLASLKALMPILLTLLICVKAYRKEKSYLLVFLIAFLAFFILGILLNFIPSKKGYQSVIGLVTKTKENYYIIWNGFHKYYIYEKNNARQFGDILQIEGYISNYEGVEYESRFSFTEYLYNSGVKYSLSQKNINEIFVIPIRIRNRQIAFLNNFDSNTKSLLDSLVFGRKDYSNELIMSASYLGCLNFLTNSGFFYSGILNVIEKIFSYKLEAKGNKLVTYLFGLLLLPFFWGKIGTYRVLIIRSIDLLSIYKKGVCENYLFKLSLSAIILLLINPFNAISSGFLISYGLCYFMFLRSSNLKKCKKWQRRILSFLYLNLFLLPLFNVKGELKILAPVFSFIFPLFSYSFILCGMLSYISVPFVRLLNGYGDILAHFIDFLEKVDLGVPIGEFPLVFLYIYYLSLFMAIYFKDKGLTNFKNIASMASLLSLLMPSLPLPTPFSQEISFINVGQGDAILIRDGFKSILIDTGGSLTFDMAMEVDIPFLRKEKVYTLDALIITHGDYDHDGAKESLAKNFAVKRIIENKNEFPLTIGNLTFYNYNIYEGDESNDQSLVLGTKIMGKSFLFMGDATTKIEKSIIRDNPNLSADILKIGHHGSKTSSSMEFLKKINPEVAIISVGKNNKYGHPDEEVVKRLKQLDIKVRRTDLEGTIKYQSYFHMPLGEL